MPRPEKSTAKATRPRGRPRKARGDDLPPAPTYAKFAARLDQVRTILGLSPRAFAKRCGVTPTNMTAYLRGRAQPGFDVLRRMSAALEGLSVDWLLFGTGGDAEPRYRNTTRTRNELAMDVAAYVGHGVRQTLAGKLNIDLPSYGLEVDGGVILRRAVEREAEAFRTWFVARYYSASQVASVSAHAGAWTALGGMLAHVLEPEGQEALAKLVHRGITEVHTDPDNGGRFPNAPATPPVRLPPRAFAVLAQELRTQAFTILDEVRDFARIHAPAVVGPPRSPAARDVRPYAQALVAAGAEWTAYSTGAPIGDALAIALADVPDLWTTNRPGAAPSPTTPDSSVGAQ